VLIPIPTDEQVAVGDVGGKAASLVRLQQSGAHVPSGVILTTRFFAPWLAAVSASDEWQQAVALVAALDRGHPDLATRTRLAELCDRAKSVAETLEFTAEQRSALEAVWELGEGPFAVRSSSPEEDLSGASFAGQYETVLNTVQQGMDAAVRRCFASCLDSRVLLYKREREFADLSPSIAVVVQMQVASESSGVVFSLNPLTNDYDEILINASWGLGEALVSGNITPDSMVVDKVTGAIVDRRIGDKGGPHGDRLCLSDDQIQALATEVRRIEQVYDMPMDVEWAFADGELHVLQARPITAFIPMPAEMLSEPGAPRHLYFDTYLTDGITMSGPVSPMGNEVMGYIMGLMIEWMITPIERQRLADYGLMFGGCRMYIDMSMYLHLVGKGKALAKQAEVMDPTIAAVFLSDELERYRPAKAPKHVGRMRIYAHLVRVLWRCKRAFKVVIRALRKRETFDAEYERLLADFVAYVSQPLEPECSLDEVIRKDMTYMGEVTMNSTYPAFMIFYIAIFRLKMLVDKRSDEQVALVDALLGGYEDDLVVSMGHALFDLSQLVPNELLDDLDRLEAALRERSLPPGFLEQWDEFVDAYGHRGPLEMDLVNPRYGDEPRLILQQVASIGRSKGAFNPHDMMADKVRAREDAYQRLRELLPPRKVRKLEKLYADVLSYCGTREYFKHHLTQLYHRYRKRLIARAERFVSEGRLEHTDDIFQVSFTDVDRAHVDSSLDLRPLVETKGALYRQQRAQVRHFPLAIDSRGRVLRAQAQADDVPEGTIAGVAISSGVATGPVKVLNDPFEKNLDPGDILVAVTTDPGWTPLFINAAAVILEIGGELQHGALVAREYGKPCVSGICDVTNQFADGQIVEVDGNTGLVRLVD
jgi:pyruvate,water dikinase